MATGPDLIIYDRAGRKAAVVEIKNKRGTSRAWAAELRRNILAYGRDISAGYLLVVTPDRLFLWKDRDSASLVPPDYEAEAEPIFAPYIQRSRLDSTSFSGHAFELIVASWLSELALGLSNRPERWASSGFFEAIRDGRIDYQAAA